MSCSKDDGPNPAHLGRERPRHGSPEPRHHHSNFQAHGFPSSRQGPGRQLAREGAQNNPDSWGHGVPRTQALGSKSRHLEPCPGCCR